MSFDNGDSAFPCQAKGTDGLPIMEAAPGMSLWDYVACHALAANIQNPRLSGHWSYKDHVGAAASFADAFIEYRNLRKGATEL